MSLAPLSLSPRCASQEEGRWRLDFLGAGDLDKQALSTFPRRRFKHQHEKVANCKNVIVLMRFHTLHPKIGSEVYATLASISKLVGVSPTTVRVVCQKAV